MTGRVNLMQRRIIARQPFIRIWKNRTFSFGQCWSHKAIGLLHVYALNIIISFFSFLESVASEQVLFLMFNKERETVHFAKYVRKDVCGVCEMIVVILQLRLGQQAGVLFHPTGIIPD